MQFQTLTIPELKAGMRVHKHGGIFEVTRDAAYSIGHQPRDGVGPSCCAYAPAITLEGEEGAYFWPGSSWTFQGNQLARVCVEV